MKVISGHYIDVKESEKQIHKKKERKNYKPNEKVN